MILDVNIPAIALLRTRNAVLSVHAFPVFVVAARPEAEDDSSSEEEEEDDGEEEIPNERRSASGSDDDSSSQIRSRLRFSFVDSHLLPTLATVRTLAACFGSSAVFHCNPHRRVLTVAGGWKGKSS